MKNEIMDQKKQIRNILFLVAIMVLTGYIFLRDYSFRELLETLNDTDPIYLFAGLSLMLLFISCEAMNIKIILKVLGKEITFPKSFGYSWIGFYFSAITPSSSGGQPAQVYYMKKDHISISDSTITLFFIVFNYQIAMVLLGAIMSLLNPKLVHNFVERLPLLLLYGVIMNVGALFLFMSLMFSKKMIPCLINIGLKVCLKLHLVKNIDAKIKNIYDGLKNYHTKSNLLKKHYRLFFKVLSITMIQMAALNAVSYMVYLSLGYREHGILDLMTAGSLLTISVSAVPLPGSVGAAEGGFLQAYTDFISTSSLKSAMIISRSISFYLPFIISSIVYMSFYMRSFHRSKPR